VAIVLGLLALFALPAAAAPRVDYLVPNHGPPEGGTPIVIVGAGFEAGATVTLEGIDATGVTVIDANTITATTPDVTTAVTGEVVVTNPDSSAGSRAGAFLFVSTIYYVDQATGDNADDGLTPETAKLSINNALSVYSAATPADPPIEVRVAEGHYLENVVLYYNVVLEGGWNSGFTERDPDTHVTVIDGRRRDFVARSYGLGVSPILDGFTLLGGERVAISGGFYATDDNVTLSNNVFVGNRTGGIGGAFYVWLQDEAPSPTVRNNVFVGNRADLTGGAIGFSTYYEALYPHDFTPTPTIADNLIVGNRAGEGGAVVVYPTPDDSVGVRMMGNRLVENTAGGSGGGIYLLSLQSNQVDMDLANNLFTGNEAGDQGGGLYITGQGVVDIDLRSNTLADNVGLFGGTQIYQSTQSSGTGTLASHVVRGPNPLYIRPGVAVSYSNVEGGYAGTGNIDADPLFVDGPLGPYYLSNTATSEPPQTQNSPSIDTADPAPPASDGVLWTVEPNPSGAPVTRNTTTRSDGGTDAGPLDQGYHQATRDLPSDLAPTLLRADPEVVSFEGDEWVVVRGSNFERRTAVRFDGVDAAEKLLVSSKVLAARPAPRARGAYQLEVRSPGPDGDYDSSDDLVATLGGLTAGDTVPPYWPGPVGIEDVEDLVECDAALGLHWATALDTDSPPVTYEIYRTDADPFGLEAFVPNDLNRVIDGLERNWWVDTGLDKNSTYWYIVQARDSSEDPRRELNFVISSKLGNSPTENLSDTSAPPPIKDLVATSPDFGATIDLTWEPQYTALMYRVYRSLDASTITDAGNEIGLVEEQYGSSFTDDTVPSDEFLYYLVTPEDGCGNQS
jgi:hypothetical protein